MNRRRPDLIDSLRAAIDADSAIERARGTRRAQYRVARVDVARRIIFIEDLDGPLSITNDAERIVAEVNAMTPEAGYRIVYRDTSGDWDELVHRDGVFVGFKPCPDRKAEWGGV